MSEGIGYRLHGKPPHIISLMLLSAFASMGAIIMTPALPKIADFFGTRVGTTQLTVTMFLLGYAIGQLIYGPLANRYGRKFALYIGLSLASIGSIFSILSSPIESFHLLVVGRFLEALGSSAGLAISITIINEFFFEEDARHVTAMLMLAFSVVPGIANAIGGSLAQYFGWRSCFYFLLLYGFVLAWPAYRLTETMLVRDHDALKHKIIARNYAQKFQNVKLICFAMLAGLSSACIYVFGAEGPFIGIHILHFTPSTYGLLALTPFIGMLIGNFVAIRLSHLSPYFLIKLAFSIELIASLLMLVSLIYFINIYSILILMALFSFAHPMLIANAISLSIQQLPDKANVTAVANFVMVSMPVLMTFILSLLHAQKIWTMPVIFLMAMLFMTLAYTAIHIKNRSEKIKALPQ